MIQPIGKPNIIKSNKQLLRDAEQKIAELEKSIERATETVAYLLVGIQALGRKLDYSPEQAKECINQFIIEREQQEHAKIKQEFAEKAKSGELKFDIIDRTKE